VQPPPPWHLLRPIPGGISRRRTDPACAAARPRRWRGGQPRPRCGHGGVCPGPVAGLCVAAPSSARSAGGVAMAAPTAQRGCGTAARNPGQRARARPWRHAALCGCAGAAPGDCGRAAPAMARAWPRSGGTGQAGDPSRPQRLGDCVAALGSAGARPGPGPGAPPHGAVAPAARRLRTAPTGCGMRGRAPAARRPLASAARSRLAQRAQALRQSGSGVSPSTSAASEGHDASAAAPASMPRPLQRGRADPSRAQEATGTRRRPLRNVGSRSGTRVRQCRIKREASPRKRTNAGRDRLSLPFTGGRSRQRPLQVADMRNEIETKPTKEKQEYRPTFLLFISIHQILHTFGSMTRIIYLILVFVLQRTKKH
jgi:hypothetical protein